MKTKDRIKEEVGLNKLLIAIFATVDISLFATIWKNSDHVFESKFLITSLGFTLLAFVTAKIFIKTRKKIKKLDFYE